MRKFIFVFVAICFPFLFTSCGSATVTAKERLAAAEVGFLEGQVSIGPNCPVEKADEPCDRDEQVYAAHKLAVLNPDRSLAKEVDLDARGNFRTELAAGSYLADVVPHDIGIGSPPDPKPFEILAGQTTTITIDIDTGIR